MKIQMVKLDFNLTPKGSLEHLRNKGFKTSFNYDEISKDAHHKSFTVAKVMRTDILSDIFVSLDKAMSEGKSFKDFQKDLEPTLAKKGWWGKKDIVNPKTGEVKTINIDAHRLKNIFKTNMRVSYAVARQKAQKSLGTSVYWRYTSALTENTRDEHASKHGMIKHRDDPFWNVNYPPNGWGCKCHVRAYSKKALQKKGWSIDNSKHEDIASKDWAYDVGDTSKIASLSKINLDSSLSTLHKATKNKEYKDMTPEALSGLFYSKMGIDKGDVFIDKVGDPLVVDDNLFTRASGHSKIRNKDRHLLLDEMIPTIKDPDEIYMEWAIGNITGEKRVLKKMFRYITVDGKKRAIMALFEYMKDKTQGVSLHLLDTASGVESKRINKLIYKRESD